MTLKENRAQAQQEANETRKPVIFHGRSAHVAHPENPTFAEFIHAVRMAVAGNLEYEYWVRHMYTGKRNVYGAIGYMRHCM